MKSEVKEHFTLHSAECTKQFGETNSYPDLWFEPQVVRCLFSLVAHRMIKRRERKEREQFAQARLGKPHLTPQEQPYNPNTTNNSVAVFCGCSKIRKISLETRTCV